MAERRDIADRVPRVLRTPRGFGPQTEREWLGDKIESNPPRTPLHANAAGEGYQPEKITGMRYDPEGGCFVCVKWAGYPVEESTWEPFHNVPNGAVLLAESLKRMRPIIEAMKAKDEEREAAKNAKDEK